MTVAQRPSALATLPQRAVAEMKRLAPVAAEHQIHIGVENVWNKFLLSPLEMRAFIDEIGSEWIGSYFDVGNVVYAGYPEQWIRILGKRISALLLSVLPLGAGHV